MNAYFDKEREEIEIKELKNMARIKKELPKNNELVVQAEDMKVEKFKLKNEIFEKVTGKVSVGNVGCYDIVDGIVEVDKKTALKIMKADENWKY